MPEEPIEHELIRSGNVFDDLELLDTKIVPTVGNDDWAVTTRESGIRLLDGAGHIFGEIMETAPPAVAKS